MRVVLLSLLLSLSLLCFAHGEHSGLHTEEELGLFDAELELGAEFEFVTQFVETGAESAASVPVIIDNTGSAAFTPKANLTHFRMRPVIDPSLVQDAPLLQEPKSIFAPAAPAAPVVAAPAPVANAVASADLSAEFESWMLRFGRIYASQEEALRRQAVWIANGQRALELSKKSGVAYTNQGPYSDLEQGEFSALLGDYASVDARAQSLLQSQERVEYEGDLMFIEQSIGVPAEKMSVDWRSISTPVKHQLKCSGSWSLAAAAVLESAAAKAGRPLESLSAQQLIDCNKGGNKACEGGSFANAFAYWKNHRSTSAQSYPYANGETRACRMASGAGPRVATTGMAIPPCTSGDCTSQNEAEIINALATYGPLAVMLDLSQLQLYAGGVISAESGCSSRGESLNHAATLVGYSPQGHWILRGNFGESWGENGYARLAFGKNSCGVANFVSFVTV